METVPAIIAIVLITVVIFGMFYACVKEFNRVENDSPAIRNGDAQRHRAASGFDADRDLYRENKSSPARNAAVRRQDFINTYNPSSYDTDTGSPSCD